jgi:multidrug resistance efflux pump
VEFDPTTLQRTRQETLSDLRQADAEIDQARADARIVDEQSRTALMKARFDVDRAALDVVEGDLIARLDCERAKLALDDARQRLRETEARNRADQAANAANLAARERRRQKVQSDLDRTGHALAGLQLRAPSAGVVSLLTNYRTGGPMSAGQEFREGDRAWSGAGIVELPDLASVHVAARPEETDQGHAGRPAGAADHRQPGRANADRRTRDRP